MTREEAKEIMSKVTFYWQLGEQTLTPHQIDTALDMAIKALEASALDKIRAEIIERDRTVKAVRSDNCCFFTAEEVLEIIDKYMAERMTEIDPVDIDKAVEHYEGTLEVLKGIDLEDNG